MTYGGHVETYVGANTFAIPGIYKILDFIYKNYSKLIPLIGKVIVAEKEPYEYLIKSIEDKVDDNNKYN